MMHEPAPSLPHPPAPSLPWPHSQVAQTTDGQPYIIWPWYDEYLFHGLGAPTKRGGRDGMLDPAEPLDIGRMTRLLTKMQTHAGVCFLHKRHLGRGVSNKRAGDSGMDEHSQDKAGRYAGRGTRAKSYAYVPPWNIARVHAGYDQHEAIAQARATTEPPPELVREVWQQAEVEGEAPPVNVLGTLEAIHEGLKAMVGGTWAAERPNHEEWELLDRTCADPQLSSLLCALDLQNSLDFAALIRRLGAVRQHHPPPLPPTSLVITTPASLCLVTTFGVCF